MAQLRYDGQVAVITGAGAGLGRAYARFFSARGAKVVVNDLGGTFNARGNDRSSKVADRVVEELIKAGGEAVADYNAVQQGDRIIETAIKTYGRIDILVNNAGILRVVTLRNMSDGDWDAVVVSIETENALNVLCLLRPSGRPPSRRIQDDPSRMAIFREAKVRTSCPHHIIWALRQLRPVELRSGEVRSRWLD